VIAFIAVLVGAAVFFALSLFACFVAGLFRAASRDLPSVHEERARLRAETWDRARSLDPPEDDWWAA
jgi:hypothetical protein